MDQKIINLFDEYTHKPLKRQEFINRLIKLTGSMAAAMAVLPLLEVNYAHGAVVDEQDDDIIIEDVTIQVMILP
jgi:carboxymethylenebutenolidase